MEQVKPNNTAEWKCTGAIFGVYFYECSNCGHEPERESDCDYNPDLPPICKGCGRAMTNADYDVCDKCGSIIRRTPEKRDD